MSTRFDICAEITLGKEGGYSDRPLSDDPGGATNWGVTRATLSHYRGRKVSKREVQRLTRTEARAIYKTLYWDQVSADRLPIGVDLIAFDAAIHSWPMQSARFIQRAVGAKADGMIGPVTLRLVNAADAVAIIHGALDQRETFLRGLPNFNANHNGWLSRLAGIRQSALAMVGFAGSSNHAPNPRRANLPPRRPKQTAATTRAVFDMHRHLIDPRHRHAGVSVLFVRGYYSRSFGRVGNDRAVYDDAAFLITPDRVTPFNANADPSVYRRRVATIAPDQAIMYRPGKHGISRGGGYDAFRQASDVTVIRDGLGEDRDHANGRFWVNLHRGDARHTSSLGCLTITPEQWDEFRALGYAALDAAGQELLPVILLEYPGDAPPSRPPEPTVPYPVPAETRRDPIAEEPFVMNRNIKPWWKSKGVVGSLIAVSGPVLGLFGIEVTPQDLHQVVSTSSQIITAGGALLALIGRLTATARIG